MGLDDTVRIGQQALSLAHDLKRLACLRLCGQLAEQQYRAQGSALLQQYRNLTHPPHEIRRDSGAAARR